MDLQVKTKPKLDWVWTLIALSALILLVLSLRFVIQSDRVQEVDVRANLTGEQRVIVLYTRPDPESAISSLLTSGLQVSVIKYDPDANPDWAYIQREENGGWVQLEHLIVNQP
jgi:hypothetical protein